MASPEQKRPDLHLASPMDRKIERPRWGWSAWPRSARVAACLIVAAGVVMFFRGGFHPSDRRLRVSLVQLTVGRVGTGIFHDFVPLRALVVPHDVIYIDASEGGRVNRVLVEPGDQVAANQPLVEFGNTNLQLQVIQQESQLNQAISQLEQNEIALEQSRIDDERTLASAKYNIVRLERLVKRQTAMATKGATSIEQKENAVDELAYYHELEAKQSDSNQRQADLRSRLLPTIRKQLAAMELNLPIVRGELDNLIVRSPVAGRVTSIDLKIGESRGPGTRLAVVVPDTGFKLSAEIEEFYLNRVSVGQSASVDLKSKPRALRVSRVYPEVKDRKFKVDLAFVDETPEGLLPGEAVQGRLSLGQDKPATLIPAGAFLQLTGGDWIFVLSPDGKTATRRSIKTERRNTEQVEVVSGLKPNEQVIVSDYTGFDRVDTLEITQ